MWAYLRNIIRLSALAPTVFRRVKRQQKFVENILETLPDTYKHIPDTEDTRKIKLYGISIPALMQVSRLTADERASIEYSRSGLEVENLIEFAEFFGMAAEKALNDRTEDGQIIVDMDSISDLADAVIRAYAAASEVINQERHRKGEVNVNTALERFIKIARENDAVTNGDFERTLELFGNGEHAFDQHTDSFDE